MSLQVWGRSLWVHPHGIVLCFNAHVLHNFGRSSKWILLTHFFETWSQGGNILKCRPCILMWTANLHSLCWHHRPTPQPLAFNLLTPQRLIITTTTMADYMFVFGLQKILSLSELLGQNILLLCHYVEWKRIMDNRIRHIVFFFLCSVSPSTVSLCTAHKLYAHPPSLLLWFGWISRATYRPGIWIKAYWVVYNESVWTKHSWNDAEEDEGKKIVVVHVDMVSESLGSLVGR